LSGGWHQHISNRDATADFTEATSSAGAQSYFVLSEVFFLPGETSLATHNVDIELYAQGGPVPIPEPESWALLLGGLKLLGLRRRRVKLTALKRMSNRVSATRLGVTPPWLLALLFLLLVAASARLLVGSYRYGDLPFPPEERAYAATRVTVLHS